MAIDSKTQLLKSVRQRKYLNKDFTSFRADMLEYARTYYEDRIRDFSEASMGGVLLDLAAYVGDTMSFYLDHQFSELFVDTAVETENIVRALQDAGVDIVGASPAVASLTFYIEVPAKKVGSTVEPDPAALPILEEGSIATADNGTKFYLIEDIDFSKKDDAGKYVAQLTVGSTDAQNIPTTFIMNASAIAISGNVTSDVINIPNAFVPFRNVTITNPDVTEIISVVDGLGNTYYQVDGLTQDTVFKRIANYKSDKTLVNDILEIIPAPYRYTKSTDPSTRLTTLQFGGGNAQTIDDDVIPDPSEFALPLYGKKTFSRYTLDPKRLLQTRTLGVAAASTTLTITYRYGGGLNHSVDANTIATVSTAIMKFENSPEPAVAAAVRASIEVANKDPAVGGDDAPTIDELKDRIPSARNSQARMVSKEDLLARVYTMPSNFGRVFRAGLRENPNNPLASLLYVISRDSDERLIVSPDTLKKNLARYLNEFRLISDGIDILDARVINIGIDFEIVADPGFNKKVVLQQVIIRLKRYFDVKNFQIDQPIIVSDITNIVFNNPGVVSVNNISVKNISGMYQNREYSSEQFDVRSNTIKNMIVGPMGSIFEVRHADFDIKGATV